ncbi:MAG: hypothetical protein NWF04_02730 [Candidatus Bathyarchaeota archaeon]|nr:hypothetical protein [Candidatus Bathyarchaeota archaeon]
MNASVKFQCPTCKAVFEFDCIGEHEFVPCPICGNDFKTAKKGKRLVLEPFEFKTAPIPT